MLTAARALTLNIESGTPLPRVAGLQDLYEAGTTPRHGEVIMVAGRSGSQKSGFALWWVEQMNLPALYFSADMNKFTASVRVASTRTGLATSEIELHMQDENSEARADILAETAKSKTTFAFGSPIAWWNVEQELAAWVEMWDTYPEVMVFDNLMDFEGADSDYKAQMEVMQLLTELAREAGSTVLILHHATDKGYDASVDPYNPPGRKDIKNGVGEKPELVLGVGLDPYNDIFRIATLKQRMGKSDLTGRTFVSLRAEPSVTRFHRKGAPRIIKGVT